jgi:Cys-rich four helix bundle protein (predicted Tat secretion target)
MERRNFLGTAAALAASSAASALLTRKVFADETPDAKMTMPAGHHHMTDPKLKALYDATTDCVKKGGACLQHCMEQLSVGETAYAGCAKSVREMLIYCRALSEAANQNSKHLKALAKITLETCQVCETECRKHKEHEVCLACAEACVACATQCKAFS